MSTPLSPSLLPQITWTEGDEPCTALWHSERGAPAPKRVVLADDTLSADTAYRLACEGVGLLWQGDFQNARMLVQALARRTDRLPERQQFKAHKQSARLGAKNAAQATRASTAANPTQTAQTLAAEAFHQHRLTQSQRARVLGMVLVPLDAAYQIALRRAPDVQTACADVWGPLDAATLAAAQARLLAQQQAAGMVAMPGDEAAAPAFTETFDDAPAKTTKPAKLSKFEQKMITRSKGAIAHVTSLRELLGMQSAQEWRKKGVPVAALAMPQTQPGKEAVYDRIHPHYGVFSPVRGEYVGLVAKAPLPVSAASKASMVAWDIGTGSGVLAAVLARRGLQHIVATDLEPRALACAQDNMVRLGVQGQVTVQSADMFPPGKAHLIVCNPPWLPARAGSPLERAVYDEGGQMLRGFLSGLGAHLAKGGEAWLVLSDLAEHLGLRSRAELLAAFESAGLKVVAQLQTKPQHTKVHDTSDPLHAARAAEVTSLWRLAVV